MANYVKVSAPRMEQDIESLTGKLEKIPVFAEELRTSMIKLSNCWEGPAWEAFQTQVASDIEYLRTVHIWLSKYINALSEAENEYKKNEKTSVDQVMNIRV